MQPVRAPQPGATLTGTAGDVQHVTNGGGHHGIPRSGGDRACGVRVLAGDLAGWVARTPIKFRHQTGEDSSHRRAGSRSVGDSRNTAEPGAYRRSVQARDAVVALDLWAGIRGDRAVDGRVQALCISTRERSRWPGRAAAQTVDVHGRRREGHDLDVRCVAGADSGAGPRDPVEPVQGASRHGAGATAVYRFFFWRFFANSARPAGALMVPSPLKPEQRSEFLQNSWAATFGSAENAAQGGGARRRHEVQAFASENNKAQLTETTQAIATQICGVFRVPTFKAGDLSKATYSNMAAGELAYVTSTLGPVLPVLGRCHTSRPADESTVQPLHRHVRSHRADSV